MSYNVSAIIDRLPTDAPLSMPDQPVSCAAAAPRWREPEGLVWRRALLFGATLALTFAAFMAPFDLFAGDGFTPFEIAGLVLFGPLFVGISLWFCNALVGFVLLATGQDEAPTLRDLPAPMAGRRTALLAVIRNEDVAAVYARLRDMDQALRVRGAATAFDVFVLSDSSDPAIAAQEAAQARQIDGASSCAFYYRRRAYNTRRKAGNVADWVRRFGGAYDYMAVLDADSLMSAELLITPGIPIYAGAFLHQVAGHFGTGAGQDHGAHQQGHAHERGAHRDVGSDQGHRPSAAGS